MATLEAFRAVLDDEGTPEIIRNHIIGLRRSFCARPKTHASIDQPAPRPLLAGVCRVPAKNSPSQRKSTSASNS
jgi:hypothetical protein